MGSPRFRRTILAALLLSAPAVLAQDPNVCDEPGDAPDVIVGDLYEVNSYGNVGDIFAYSVGTTSCNIGTCWLNWFDDTNEHPVIAQNMFRYKDGRLTQIGQSWLKHGFFALSEELCSTSCIGTNGDHLGVNCSDPYSAGLNGAQGRLGPRWQVNAATGFYPYPFDTAGQTGDAIYKRLQVHRDDLDPALNAGASYFVEGQYISADDAQAGNGTNNNSYRPIDVLPNFDIALTGTTAVQQYGIKIWGAQESGVVASRIDIVNDGTIFLSAKSTDNGDGTFHFEYAVQNINSDRSAQAFWVPVSAGSTVTNIGFHDVDYHSGEPFDNTDWVMFHDTGLNRVFWAGVPYDVNPDANALRWGTMYNFWFDVDATSQLGSVFLDLFKPALPGDPDTVDFTILAPSLFCNGNGICEPQETCSNCPSDCITTTAPTGFCGDGICEEALLEDCVSCAMDCAGLQGAFCCGNGGGDNPIPCTDEICNSFGFMCGSTETDSCCGEGTCDPSEDSCICAADCGNPPAMELFCSDTLDNDCDGNVDCNDQDCCTDGSCFTGVDNDLDGVAGCDDCNDSDASVWETPGEVPLLTLSKNGASATLDWVPPTDLGANSVNYEALRSSSPDDFILASLCLGDTDPGDLTNVDTDVPVIGSLYQYLIRATNDCPGAEGIGTIGSDSDDNQRPGAICP